MLRYRYRGEKNTSLSLKISKYLEKNTYGFQCRNEIKETQLMGQYLEEYFLHHKAITSGGRAEGSNISRDSDSDVMGVIGGYLVVTSDNIEEESTICISIDRERCYPCYCKLELSFDQYQKFETLRRDNYIDNGIKRSIVYGDTKYISSEIFNRNVIPENLIPADNFTDDSVEFNGPAKTNKNVDYVQAFEMKSWPEEAKKWRLRKRRNNWPSEKMLDRLLKETSCHVAPIGNKSSSEYDLEWRLSFVEIERELIWSMNDTQFKCYVLLKMIKSNFEDNVLKEISSYHMKNIVFWMCEELPENEWIPENLLSCVKSGLKMLELCILHGNNAHYFVPENNLFHCWAFSSDETKTAIMRLQIISSIFLEAELSNWCLDFEHRQLSSVDVPFTIDAYTDKCTVVLGYCIKVVDRGFIKDFFDKFPEADLLLPSFRIAQALAQFQNRNFIINEDRNVESAVEKIRTGHAMDYFTSTIYIALLYFMHTKYENVIKELKPILSQNICKLYISSLGEATYINLNSGAMTNTSKDENCSVKDIRRDRKNLVMHFNIGYHITFLLPYPLRLLLYINGPRAIYSCNPVVVSYYLVYMSEYLYNSSETKYTMHLFEKAVSNSSHQRNYFLHVALLGYCYYVTGNYDAAYKCYAKSLNIYPSVVNVAVYLMAILAHDAYMFRKTQTIP